MPLVAVTSSKSSVAAIVEEPAGIPRYASGVQYDLCAPSRLQKTFVLGGPAHVVAYKKVQQAIPVIVKPSAEVLKP